jgi:F-type H+-transporting ATPase subunit delta
MSELTTVARPYAKAAFEFALDNSAIDEWFEMLSFAAEVAKNDDMNQFLNGSVASESMAELFIKVCGEQLNGKGQNFVKVMAESRRLTALPAVVSLFADMRNEYIKEINVDVFAATELTETQTTNLIASLEKRLARKVKLNCSVDTSVVGGLLIKAGDTIIDGSVRGKLDRLATALQS